MPGAISGEAQPLRNPFHITAPQGEFQDIGFRCPISINHTVFPPSGLAVVSLDIRANIIVNPGGGYGWIVTKLMYEDSTEISEIPNTERLAVLAPDQGVMFQAQKTHTYDVGFITYTASQTFIRVYAAVFGGTNGFSMAMIDSDSNGRSVLSARPYT